MKMNKNFNNVSNLTKGSVVSLQEEQVDAESAVCCGDCDKCSLMKCVDSDLWDQFHYDPCASGDCDCDCYSVRVNRAAGEYEIVKTCPDWYRTSEGHFTETFVGTYQECQDYVDREVRESTVWAVFVDRPSGEVYYCEVNDFAGNYKGSGHHPFSYDGEYKSEEEARVEVEKWKKYFASIER